MNYLPNNFGKSDLCEFNCKELMSNDHLLNCAYLNESQLNTLTPEPLGNGNIDEKIKVFKKLQFNSNKRNESILKQGN